MRSRQRTTDWVTHTIREHNKEADLWASKGARERAEEWVDASRGKKLPVYVDSGMEAGQRKCGGSIVLMASEPHGWFTFYKKCGPFVPWMLKWVDAGCILTIHINGWKKAPAKSAQLFELLRLTLCLFTLIMHFRWHASHAGGPSPPRLCHHTCVVLEGGTGTGVRRYGSKVICGIEG